jgi:hypothetical protein
MSKSMKMLCYSKTLSVAIPAVLMAGSALQAARSAAVPLSRTVEQIEADWLRQEQLRGAASASSGGSVTPDQDAIGACDGIKDGTWGFHTERQDDPWWQIDLGKITPLERIAIYNRCELAERASRLVILLSDDGEAFKQVYQHNGTAFFGHSDGKPLIVEFDGATARYVRLQQPGRDYFHLDEVEIYAKGIEGNVALGKPATQSSTSQWSKRHLKRTAYDSSEIVSRGLKLAENLAHFGLNVDRQIRTLNALGRRSEQLHSDASEQLRRDLYLQARRTVREMAFSNPLLNFDTILFVKRAPGTLPHMSDQHYGWWSRPGGGIYLLENFKSETPHLRCLTEGWPAGSFLSPDLSYDGGKVLFSCCKYYSHVASMEKVDKEKLPEDAFYHVFEIDLDGAGVRQLTHGRYDDFDARYLPDGDIVFLSTRKGQFVQCSKANTSCTEAATLPDSYVRCGGDNKRPCAVFTLHAIDCGGGNLRPISAFENFEWTPSVADDGRILYARWDYIDRFNGHFMSLWSTNQDGTNPQLVYGNFTPRPQCIFEARSIPGSDKLIFTASSHHSITGGSVVLLDRACGTEGPEPLTRLTPEVCFPEAEGWPESYYANPYPLSQEHYLAAWSDRRLPPHQGSGQVTDERNPINALGLYLCDAFGNLELIYRDPNISSMYPIPVRPRSRPFVRSCETDSDGPQEGRFLVQDVYRGLRGVNRGTVKSLRIVGVPPKTQPQMDSPSLGVSREDPGKFVLGTVPVEEDGSAYLRVPSGVPVFFQALDERGLAIQTMRSLTYVQPGQTLSCIGCHEPRELAPGITARPSAALREASRIAPGPAGSWPLRFDTLVQPVLDKSCVSCHRPGSGDKLAARFDLTAENSYQNLMAFAEKDLEKLAFERDQSFVGQAPAAKSKLLALLTGPDGHQGVRLDDESFNRLVTWIDVYAQKLGSFSEQQEQELRELRHKIRSMLAESD